MRDKCIDCEKEYHPQDDFCRRCELEEAKQKFIEGLMQTKVVKLMERFVDRLSMKLGSDWKAGFEDGFKEGMRKDYSKAETDYHAQSEKDRQSAYDCGYEAGYRKGIDDFIEKIQWEYLNGCGIPCREIEFLINISSQVAERLKEGGKMIKKGDTVICETGVIGIVIKQYYPTSCEQQIMIECADGRKYHAPTRLFRLLKAGGENETVL